MGYRYRCIGLWNGLAAVLLLCAGCRFSPLMAQSKASFQTKMNPKDGLVYVWIPPGTFQMGCSAGDPDCHYDEMPAHMVSISKGFWMGQTLVTQAAYKKVDGVVPSRFRGDELPVDNVSWNDAQSYCQSTGMRLPTEAEWEYAARGKSPAARYAPLNAIAWYSDNSGGKAHPVAQKQPNSYGLYDMLGNLWEWVADWYGAYSGASVTDPQGPASGDRRVLRGGSWFVDDVFVRVSYRGQDLPALGYDIEGFRCAGD